MVSCLAEAKRRAEPGPAAAGVLGELIRRNIDLLDWGGRVDIGQAGRASGRTNDSKRSRQGKKREEAEGQRQRRHGPAAKGNRASAQRSQGNGLRYRVMALHRSVR